ANQSNFSIERVDLSDSATVLHAVVHFSPGYWISISDLSAIVAEGEKYQMQSIDGIPAGEKVWMPDSAVIRFSMTFPAIPADVRSFDFSEGSDGWKLWDVDLTGKASHLDNLSAVPSSVRKRPADTKLPDPVMAWGDSTTVRVHLLGYRPEMGNKLLWGINTIHSQTGTDRPVAIDSLGNATIRVAISAPADLFLIGFSYTHQLSASLHLMPGETVDLYADAHMSGIRNMMMRDDDKLIEELYDLGYRPAFSDGLYPMRGHDSYVMDLYSGEFGDYHMNGDEYTDYIIGEYNRLNDSIAANAALTDFEREYWRLQVQSDLIAAAADARNWLKRNYRHVHGDDWSSPVPADSVPVEELSQANVERIASLVDFTDPNLLLARELSCMLDIDLWRNAGIDAGILEAASLYKAAYDAAEDVRLDTVAVRRLRELCAPMADEVEDHYRAIRERLDSFDPAMLAAVPDVEPSKLLSAIVAPHRGKVVMVDLWNTWCGPCRAALTQNEPEKDGDLSSDDIVWIYIADESSPLPKYLDMIKDIRGVHYRLSSDQIETLRKQFAVDGIPYYILVDREGHAEGRPDLRAHSSFKAAILSALKR
ncbi:MAG: TlpA family protein disulfide reductase, partial [Muribaculaceae bacterium]|nr:TlpA family protein disulfide reductase [Muribaculaceae bacterium]